MSFTNSPTHWKVKCVTNIVFFQFGFWFQYLQELLSLFTQTRSMMTSGLVLHGGNEGDCLHVPWSLPWCP